jgi:hypothetical protein
MIPYDIDPSLHDGEPHETLDDGFSPPPNHQGDGVSAVATEPAALEAALGEKSPF